MIAKILLHQHPTSANEFSIDAMDLIMRKLLTEMSSEKATEACTWCLDKAFFAYRNPDLHIAVPLIFMHEFAFRNNMEDLEEANAIRKMMQQGPALSLFFWSFLHA